MEEAPSPPPSVGSGKDELITPARDPKQQLVEIIVSILLLWCLSFITTAATTAATTATTTTTTTAATTTTTRRVSFGPWFSVLFKLLQKFGSDPVDFDC